MHIIARKQRNVKDEKERVLRKTLTKQSGNGKINPVPLEPGVAIRFAVR